MEDEQATIPISRHLKVGVGTVAFALGCIVAMLLLGWEHGSCLLWLLMVLALLFGWFSLLGGLFLKSNRRGWRAWMHIGLLLVIPPLAYLGNHLFIEDLRARIAVAVTGGRDSLQTWAVGLLDGPRDTLDFDGWKSWGVPRDQWSEQVRRLKPNGVGIQPVFENGQEGVVLCYGGGFFHWWIVVGRPGSRPDPKLNDPNGDNFWIRWGDGVYDWQQG